MKLKKALSIAGSDCSGGAGIQADLKPFAAHGVYGASAVTAVVAENTCRVLGIRETPPDMIALQIDAVFEDIGADAVKIGMLFGADGMRAVAERLIKYAPANVVADPVMLAKGGAALMVKEAVDTFKRFIIPLSDLLTPNIPEAEVLSGIQIRNQDGMREAAKAIFDTGAKNVLVKGGHAAAGATDILYDGRDFYSFSAERIDTKNTHGTGCTFSSAIAANLALGSKLTDAVAAAKKYITAAIKYAPDIGRGNGPTNHFYKREGLISPSQED